LSREWFARDKEADAPRAGERDAGRDGAVVAGNGDGERAVERRGDVIGVSFHLAGNTEERPAIERLAHDRVRRHHAPHDRGRTRAKAPSDRDRPTPAPGGRGELPAHPRTG